ncbi:hypothetical protein CYMTET_37437 [Cymbomonas tetramitiformis]|uniref:Uncharacterized protein n=1 Tax=Cymbomonas tetramitiformis TaxID=36881 RepID=A0AAE0F6G1_9CHLO|nr:hypothetical protein CYMTET_37437 [Cymbomonas tetramitiformis]
MVTTMAASESMFSAAFTDAYGDPAIEDMAVVYKALVMGCNESLVDQTYGDRGGGSAGFAELIGVACGGECHAGAARWGGVRSGDAAVTDARECAALCGQVEGCAVWTLNATEGECYLRRASWLAPALAASPNQTTGARNCDTPWLTFPVGLRLAGKVPHQEPCLAVGKDYGGDGACEQMEVGGDAPACGGFTWVALADAAELCILRGVATTGCAAVFADRPEAVAGLGGACVVASPAEEAMRSAGIDASEVAWFSECDTPRCTAALSDGEFLGTYSFKPAEGCHYDVLTPTEMRQCMGDRWQLISGGSNAILLANAWANNIEPGLLDIEDDGIRTAETDLLDIVWDSRGSNLHTVHLRWDQMMSGWGESDWQAESFQSGAVSAEMRRALLAQLAAAPAAPGGFRLTLLVGQYFQNSRTLLEAAHDPSVGAWGGARKGFFAQIMIWYFVCGVWRLDFCNNQDLENGSPSATLSTYMSDLDDFLEAAAPLCAGDSSLGCVLAPHVYESDGDSRMITYVRQLETRVEALHASNSSLVDAVQFLNVYQMTSLAPSEVVDSHWMQPLTLWVVFILHNLARYDCPAVLSGGEAVAAGCPEAVAFGDSCLGSTINAGCEGCSCDNEEDDWECGNARQCTYEALSLADADASAAYGCDQTLTFGALPSPSDSSADTDSTESWSRLWRGEEWEGWLLAIAAWLPLLLATAWRRYDGGRPEASMPSSKVELTANDTGSTSVPSHPMPLVWAQADAPTDPENAVTADSITVPKCAATESPVERMSKDPEQGAHGVVECTEARKAERLEGLGCARLIASTHIVCGHLYAKGALADVYLFGWGFTWVPWFFMLSGYVLTHARLGSSKPEATDPPLVFLWKRTATIFPMYAFGVFLALLVKIADSKSLPDTWILALQSVLLQSWVPQATENALQTHCWFLSSMLLYWATFGRVYPLVRRADLPATCGALLALACLPWLTLVVPALADEPLNWYTAHQFGDTGSSTDLGVVVLKFHPVCYMHVFLFGMLLARLRALLLLPPEPGPQTTIVAALRPVCGHGAVVGYTGLLLVFFVKAIRPAAHKLSSRLSILMPLQGLLLLGLSSETDPVSLVFQRLPALLGEVSYAQYVLQFVVYDVWMTRPIETPAFFLFLLGVSVLAYYLVQRPGQSLWMEHQRFTPAAPVTLLIALMIAAATYDPGSSSSAPCDDPYVGYSFNEYRVVDVCLNLTAPRRAANGDALAVINPSLAVRDQRLVLAARGHAIATSQTEGMWNGRTVTEHTTVWTSDVLIGSNAYDAAGWAGWDVAAWGLDVPLEAAPVVVSVATSTGHEWGYPGPELCEPEPSYIAANNTLLRGPKVTGAEDPKLLNLAHGMGLIFTSLPPVALAPNGAECHQSKYAVKQMYMTKDVDALLQQDDRAGVRIACGSLERDEKNWIGFVWEEQMMYVYSIAPHRILHVRAADGLCVAAYESSYPPLMDLVTSNSKNRIHGSGTATKVETGDGAPYYVALMHTKSEEGLYTTMAYTFQASPPFAILRVSQALPLQNSAYAFASGLLLIEDKAVITYGVHDSISRALVMPFEALQSALGCTQDELAEKEERARQQRCEPCSTGIFLNCPLCNRCQAFGNVFNTSDACSQEQANLCTKYCSQCMLERDCYSNV